MDTGPGRLGLLLCRVNSDPLAQLRLLHGDRLVASTLQGVGELAGSSPRLKVAVAPNTLRLEIHDAGLEDEGVYTCEATNTLGQTSASASFDAQGQCGGVSMRVGGSSKRREACLERLLEGWAQARGLDIRIVSSYGQQSPNLGFLEELFLKTEFYTGAQWTKLIRKWGSRRNHSRAREACILSCAPHQGQGGLRRTLLGIS